MTTEQQDTVGDSRRHQQFQAKTPLLFELVKIESKGDFRETWKEEQTVSVHATELGAYKAGLKANFIVRPLKVQE